MRPHEDHVAHRPARPQRAAVFLDRDGTLNEDPGYVHQVADLRLRPGVMEGLHVLTRLRLPLLVITNQGGIGRGLFTEREMHAFNGALVARLATEGVALAGFYWCPHHPQAAVDGLKGPCECRKPAPGLFHRAAQEHQVSLAHSFSLGDKVSDVQAGKRAGCTTVLIAPAGSTANEADHVTPTFLEAANLVRHLIEKPTLRT